MIMKINKKRGVIFYYVKLKILKIKMHFYVFERTFGKRRLIRKLFWMRFHQFLNWCKLLELILGLLIFRTWAKSRNVRIRNIVEISCGFLGENVFFIDFTVRKLRFLGVSI